MIPANTFFCLVYEGIVPEKSRIIGKTKAFSFFLFILFSLLGHTLNLICRAITLAQCGMADLTYSLEILQYIQVYSRCLASSER